MEEVESYPESFIIKLWERSFQEDWKRYGANFEDKKESSEIDRAEYNRLMDIYK